MTRYARDWGRERGRPRPRVVLHDDERAPVRMNPELRFGRLAIKGIRTGVLWEHAESGEDVEETAEAFDLEPDDVRWALAYETSLCAA